MTNPRRDAVEIWNAGVDSVRASPLVCREVHVSGDTLSIGEHQWSRSDFDRLIIVGAGKAGTAMAAGLIESLDHWLPVVGWINVPAGTESTVGDLHIHPARPAGVNEPTAEGVAGTHEILKLVSAAVQRDLCIALISGGGSALLPAPVDGITLADKLEVTRFLSAAGADITELNTVRKHLSSIKGGGLLRACRAGELVTLVLSDVLGDPLDLIASGPTVPDTSAAHDALSVLSRYDPNKSLDDRIYETLSHQQTNSTTHQSELGKYTTIVIGNNAVAVDEAGIRAEKLGYNHAMQSARTCEGAAEEVGHQLAKMTVGMLRADPKAHRTDCLITGGEPTVTLATESERGRGGRNQQLVLAAYQHLLAMQITPQQWERLCILSGGTDGEDGPTDAAGAILDADVHRRASELGLDVEDHLRRNDAYAFFDRAGGLLMTGPTGTNVCDLRVSVIAGE
jgi:glycerate 2-kinase